MALKALKIFVSPKNLQESFQSLQIRANFVLFTNIRVLKRTGLQVVTFCFFARCALLTSDGFLFLEPFGGYKAGGIWSFSPEQ